MLLAFLVANAVATLLITLCMLFEWEEVLRASGAHPGGSPLGVFGLIMSAKMLAPAMLVILLAEHFRIRAAVLYAVMGGLGFAALASALGAPASAPSSVTLMGRELDIMTGAGIAAGFVYWAIAGRHAGAWRDTARASQ